MVTLRGRDALVHTLTTTMVMTMKMRPMETTPPSRQTTKRSERKRRCSEKSRLFWRKAESQREQVRAKR
jgi:hypothetical protein